MNHDKHLISFLTPAIWVSKLYGCLPLSFGRYEYDVKIFFIGIVYGAVLVGTSALYRIVLSLTFPGITSENPIAKTSALLGSGATLISFTSYIFYIKNIRNTYINLLEYSKQLDSYKYLNKVLWLTTGEIVLSEIMCLGYYISYYLSYPETFYFAENLAELYLRYVITLFRFQFANSLLFLYSAFQLSNEEFFQIIMSKRLLLDVNASKSGGRMKNVTSIINMYTKVCDSCQTLNTCFGPTLAVASIWMMLQVVVCCYSLVVKTINISMFLFWFCSFVVEEWFVLYSCENVMGETKKTGALVHGLLAQTKDPRLKEQLQEFSLQLLHRKVKFTACGLFPLNYTLIYMTAGAVTTYLVILIQFQTASDPTCKATKSN